MKVHLVDGTYELFRNYFGAPPKKAPDGREVGATLGLLRSLFMLVSTPGVTHVACAFDHVVESFRNELFAGYKTGEGVAPDLLAQFPLAERAVAALGLVVWPQVELEADDALATAAARFAGEPGVEQVVICSPDKDLAQAVTGTRVVCWDRRRDIVLDEQGVIDKFGVPPQSIPDWLALVGDAADGFPGIPGWGAKSAATVLARFDHLEAIPQDPHDLGLPPGRAARLVESLAAHRDEAFLYRRLATLRDRRPHRGSGSPTSSGAARRRTSRTSAGSWATRRSPSASPRSGSIARPAATARQGGHVSTRDTIAIEEAHMPPFFAKIPISIERGDGVYVWDEEGVRYLDLTAGWGVTSIGHAHPAILAALTEQGALILQNPDSGLTYSPARARLLSLLAGLLPANLTRVFFSNSGAEANDAAIKLARKVTGRRHLLATEAASTAARSAPSRRPARRRTATSSTRWCRAAASSPTTTLRPCARRSTPTWRR